MVYFSSMQNISYYEDKSNKSTYDILANSSPLDTGLSNIYKKFYTTQSYGTGYRFRKDNLSFALGVNYNISQLRNEQTYPFVIKYGEVILFSTAFIYASIQSFKRSEPADFLQDK